MSPFYAAVVGLECKAAGIDARVVDPRRISVTMG